MDAQRISLNQNERNTILFLYLDERTEEGGSILSRPLNSSVDFTTVQTSGSIMEAQFGGRRYVGYSAVNLLTSSFLD